MFIRVLRFLYHFAVYSIGVVVLLAAVGVSLIRLALPDIGIYRSEIEAWVSNYMGYPIAIHSVSATWYGWTPHLHLTNIDLLNKAGTSRLTHFQSADISLNPLATLVERRFVPRHLTISGFKLEIERLGNGAIYIAGINVSGSEHSQVKDNELADWLFSQERINIRDAQVKWKDALNQQKVIPLTNVSLSLRSDGQRIQVEGSTTLPRSYGKKMDFAFDASGNLLTSNWSGVLYLHADDINPDNWYHTYRPLNMNIAGGSADIRVWSSWKNATLSKVEGELEYRNFAALIGAARLHVDKLGYLFMGERTGAGGWRLDMKVQDLITQNGLWPKANIRVHAEPIPQSKQMRYSVRFDYLKLDDLTPLISQLAFVPESARQRLAGLAVTGQLRNGKLIYDPSARPGHQLYVDARFNHLSTESAGGPVRISGASGRVTGNLRSAVLQFDHDSGDVTIPALELDHLRFTDIEGKLYWSKMDNAWRAGTGLLAVSTPDFNIDLSGSVSNDTADKAPNVDILAHANGADLEKLKTYIPRSSRFHMRDWMDKAVLSGKMTSADVVLRGNVGDFPFDDHAGQFQALLGVENTALEYSTKWPPVDGVDAEVHVHGRTLDASVDRGDVFNSRISDATVHIEDLLRRDKLIDMQGRIAGPTNDLRLFVAQSPLRADATLDRLREALNGGDMQLNMQLAIPFHKPGVKPEIKGRLTLFGANLNSKLKNLQLSDISGPINFNRNSATADHLGARMFGQRVTLSVSGTRNQPKDPPSLTIHGTADPAFIAARLADFFPTLDYLQRGIRTRLQGHTQWDARIAFVPDKNGVRNELDVTSDLQGLAVDLPPPLGKPASASVDASITRDLGQTTNPEIRGRYGDVLSYALMLHPSSRGLAGAQVHFGPMNEIPQNAGSGIHVTGAIHELPVQQWWNVLKPNKGSVAPAAFDKVDTDFRVNTLDLLGQRFKQVTVKANCGARAWDVKMDGPGIAGTIKIGSNSTAGASLKLNLDRLYLKDVEGKHSSQHLDPDALPHIDADIADFRYNGKDLGHLKMQGGPISDGLSINHFSFDKRRLTINGSGKWLRKNGNDNSSFKIALHADRMDTMLNTFGYNADPISKGETKLAINARWNGAPMEFSLAKLNGTLKMRIKDGQLLDVDPKAGRLFGLLSIQALPRRLSLDFSDLFSKGLAFDVIQGTFNIYNGNAYTNDLYLRGPSAIMSVTGRTGLADRDYDQVVTVMPQVANTLPVASALFGPVGIGVGAALYLAGQVFSSLHQGIDKLLQYQYSISGSWDNPVIQKYHGHDQASG